ncbi:DUF417 family protein [Arthrospiribacter ruber]|uniref:DUF417 family protein n=1 Tax=Arthrospiribacter ruber TaxID=2487934 RepID=A0A951MAI6_9BACT|nr:DUF417 family protein [Arthrospiribacter ruber]MBW3467996.1 DUF417 family protein [Arthrospiribacter ruber]
MVNNILKVEQIGKVILRMGIVIYIWSIAILSFQWDKDKLWMAAVLVVLVLIPVLLLLHFKSPKIGVVGGISAGIFFLVSAFIIFTTDMQVEAPWKFVYLHIVKDILLFVASIVLTGESLKELVRDKITQPFPKA